MSLIYFAVLELSCENKSTITHTNQFMVCTEEWSVLYLYNKFEAESKRWPKNFEIWSRDSGHVNLRVALWYLRRRGPLKVIKGSLNFEISVM